MSLLILLSGSKLKLNRKILAIAVLCLVSFIVSLSFGQGPLSRPIRIPALGLIEVLGLQIHADAECTVVLDSIDWGRLEPGGSASRRCYVRLTGNTPSTLSLSTENLVPAGAGQYLALSWDYGGQVVNPAEVLQVTLTLNIDPSIAGVENFSFDIIITATEAT